MENYPGNSKSYCVLYFANPIDYNVRRVFILAITLFLILPYLIKIPMNHVFLVFEKEENVFAYYNFD